jgi:outer membrane protein assembly factor BamB
MVVELAGVRQLLVVTGERAVGLTLEGEGPLWEVPWVTDYGVNAAQPVIAGDDRFVISAGYGHGAALVEVEGDDESLRAREVWKNRNLKNKFSSSVFHRGHVYGLDEGILACIDVESGERCWKGGRYGHGQLLLADGHLVILGEKGQVALVRATPEEHQELFVFDALDGKTWNTPAMTGEGILLVRNAEEMAAFDLAPR